jgi:tetratricopeptide (TPR) repeat protein
MNNLALAYQASGQLAKAVTLLEETLQKRKATLGPNHPDTLNSMNNLALAYQASDQLAKAVPLLEEMLKLRRARLGPDHPDTLQTRRDLDFVRNMSTAQERYRVNLATWGPDHLHTLLAQRDLAQMYMATNGLDEGEAILVEVIDGMKTQANIDAIRVFTIGLLQRCLTTRERRMPDSWLTFRCQSLLGGAFLGQKKYAEAEALLRAGYQGMKQWEKTIPPARDTVLPEALDRLVELYTATNQPTEAAQWRAERAKYPHAKKPVAPEKK